MVMTEDITKDLLALNNEMKVNENHAEWTKRFCAIIQFYSDVQQ